MGNHLSMPISASGSCQVWQPCKAVRLSLPIVDIFGPCCFIWSISHLTLSFSFSQTQQRLWVLPRSTSTSASGSCQEWQGWITVRLALPIVDSCGRLLFYSINFTSHPFFFLLPNTTAFYGASSFNADISNWVVSSVTTMYGSKSCLATGWLWWSFVVLFGPFHILHVPFFFFHLPLPNTTAFNGASSFNADLSNWVVSSVTTMYNSTFWIANCW